MRSSLFPLWLLTCSACAPQVVTAVEPTEAGRAGSTGSSGASSGGTGGAAEGGGGGDALPDAGSDAGPPEPMLRGDALIHRWGFSGSGTIAFDAKGAAHGALIATQLANDGALRLSAGTTAQYVDLPNRLVSGLTNATFEVWLTWNGGADWQRIFDFGDSTSMVEDERSAGRSYVFISPHGSGNFVRAVYKNAMIREVIIDAEPALTVGKATYLALVFDDTNDRMQLFRDGALIGDAELDSKLSQIHDVNDWIGRSQFAADSPLLASIDELRIYDEALTEAEIQKSFAEGPDADL